MKKIVAVDFYDLIIQQHSLYTPEDIDELFRGYAVLGIDTVLWRLSVCGQLLYHTQTPDMVTPGEHNNPNRVKTLELLKKYDPAEAAVRSSKKYGIKLLFWVTLYDDCGFSCDPLEAQFCRDNPQFSWRTRDGKEFFHGILSYAYPEVVEFRMRQLKEIVAYGADGLYLCNRSHSRPEPVCRLMKNNDHKKDRAAYQKLLESEFKRCRGIFGYDPPALESYKGDLDDEIAWQRHRGSYFTSFMEQVRSLDPGLIWFGLRYAPDFGQFIYGDHFFDWERLTDSTLVDALAYDLQPPDYDKEEDYPEFYRKTKGEKLLWMHLSKSMPDTILKAYAPSLERWKPHMDGIILFEAYTMTYNAQYREFIKRF